MKIPQRPMERKRRIIMLKNILLGVPLLMIPIMTSLFADTKETVPAIVWEKTFEDAQAKAKASGKPILLDFYMIA